MSGLPHPFASPPGNETKPVTHVVDWRKDGVATVRWCGGKYLFEAALVLEAGETKPCPMCGKELHHDRKTKGVVEGGFPKVPNRTGGQMGDKLRDELEKLQVVYDDARNELVSSTPDGSLRDTVVWRYLMAFTDLYEAALADSGTANMLGPITGAERDAARAAIEATDAPPSTNPDTVTRVAPGVVTARINEAYEQGRCDATTPSVDGEPADEMVDKLNIVGSIDTTVRNGAFCEPSLELAAAAQPIVGWLNELESYLKDIASDLPDDDWDIGFPEVFQGLEIGFLRQLRAALAVQRKEEAK